MLIIFPSRGKTEQQQKKEKQVGKDRQVDKSQRIIKTEADFVLDCEMDRKPLNISEHEVDLLL